MRCFIWKSFLAAFLFQKSARESFTRGITYMASTVYVQVRNLTTNSISGSVAIDSRTPVKFGPLQPNGGISQSFTEANLSKFQCAVSVQGAPHNGTAKAQLQIPDGAESYLNLDVTQNGFVNMFPAAPGVDARIS